MKPRVPIKQQIRQLDPLGTILLLPALICLILALQWGGVTYAWNDGRIIALWTVFAVLFVGFVAVQVFMNETATFPPAAHTHVASLPGMWERTVSVSSAAKSFNATGWKTGWAVGSSALIDEVQRVKQFMSYVGAAPFQPAVADALDTELPWVRDMAAGLAAKKELLASTLRAAGLHVYDSDGTYYLVADIPAGFEDDIAFCNYLIEHVGVAAIPLSVFCDHKEYWRTKVRFAFCKKDETLQEACRRLQRLAD